MSSVAGHTDIGPSSDENQDAYLAVDTTDGGRLLVVCDGMGGMGRGAEAAKIAIERLEMLLVGGGSQSTVRAALMATDRHIRQTLVDPGPDKPGCTAVAVLIREDRAIVGWAGDARAMHVRRGHVHGHTVDHKLVEELMATGHLQRDKAKESHLSHVVTRCLGGRRSDEDAPEPEVLQRAWQLQPGDALVLCSDGLTDVIDEAEVAAITAGETPQTACAALVQAALDNHTKDNVTVLVYTHRSATAGPTVDDTPTVPQPTARVSAAPKHPDVPGPRPDPLIEVASEVPAAAAPLVQTPERATPPPLPKPTLGMGPLYVIMAMFGVGIVGVIAMIGYAMAYGLGK